MEITYLKTWIFFAMIVRQFIDGAEEYFIAPTAWYYIKSLGQNMLFLGLVMSAFQFSALPSSPILGELADRVGYSRCIIIVSLFLKFVAYILYAIPVSAYFPLIGRILGGLTDGSIGVVYGQIILYTPQKHRTQVFLILDGVFTVGTLLGPAVSVFLIFNVNIFGWKIDAGNSPGIVLALLWLGMFVVSLWFPSEFGTTKVTVDNSDQDQHMVVDGNDNDGGGGDGHDNDGGGGDGHKRVDCSDGQDHNEDDCILPATKDGVKSQKYGSYSTIFLMFYLVILCFFYSSTVTFYVPLLAQEHFHLRFIHVKMLFLVSSVFCMVLFLGYYIAAKYYDEAQMLLFSMMMQVIAIWLLTYIAFSWNSGLGAYGGYVLLPYICLGMPFFSFSLCCSVLSYITDPNKAAFYQSMSIAALHLGNLLGRLISSYIFTVTELLCFCFGQFVCWIVGALWFALEFSNIRRTEF
ncbi:uncharacterized protein LOC114539006 isoform X1 [Dendronephthya gigantea]|uniref:uncharacterized protein LOC114539006 isoform X1 n=1 Tax=Dendronephthya gigantea TaxID=151771 RepID=UPI00106D57D9|nr:uncharacterized protein LOC114539006 isoform X1 [Dendronephthya gigantea]XP_028415643.1 uncharacterized protein LOC114539006 isoform X1 [Dendronephthya gigantea]